MKICMLTTSAGPNGVYHAGAERDVVKDEAEALIQGGYAKLAADQKAREARQKEKKEADAEEEVQVKATRRGRGGRKS